MNHRVAQSPSGKTFNSVTFEPGLDARTYARWLRVGLLAFYNEGAGLHAFPGLDRYYGRQESVLWDIVAAFADLKAESREAFRDAVVMLVRETPFNDESFVLLTALLKIALGVQAYGILAVITQKAFTLRPGDAADELIEAAFECARDLALASGAEAEHCLKHIIKQSVFPATRAKQALVALTQANSKDFPGHFACLMDMLDRELGYFAPLAKEPEKLRKQRNFLLRQIRQLPVPLADLAKPFRIVDGSSRPEIYNWWQDTLVENLSKQELRDILNEPSLAETTPVKVGPSPVIRVDIERLTDDKRMVTLPVGGGSLKDELHDYLGSCLGEASDETESDRHVWQPFAPNARSGIDHHSMGHEP